jgi:hypothetical protein
MATLEQISNAHRPIGIVMTAPLPLWFVRSGQSRARASVARDATTAEHGSSRHVQTCGRHPIPIRVRAREEKVELRRKRVGCILVEK